MRFSITRWLVAALLFMSVLPAWAQAPQVETPRLTRYVYTVSWEGSAGRLPRSGRLEIMFQQDRTADQQQVFVVDPKSGGILAHLILAEGVGFLAQPGKEQQVMQDFVLGAVLTGEYLTVHNLLDWAEGRDARTNVNTATLKKNAQGRLVQLREDNWQVDYGSEWKPSGTSAESLPTRWTLTRDNSAFKVGFELKEAQAFTEGTLPVGYKPISVM